MAYHKLHVNVSNVTYAFDKLQNISEHEMYARTTYYDISYSYLKQLVVRYVYIEDTLIHPTTKYTFSHKHDGLHSFDLDRTCTRNLLIRDIIISRKLLCKKLTGTVVLIVRNYDLVETKIVYSLIYCQITITSISYL